MNVLFVLRSFPSCGGVQSITKIIAESLLDRGLNVTVLSCIQTLNECDNLNSFRFHHLSLPSSVLMSDINIQYFHTILEDDKVDIIINQGVYRDVTTFLYVALRHKKKYKVLSVIHSDPLGEIKDLKYQISQKGFKPLIKRTFLSLYKQRIKSIYINRLKAAEAFSSAFVLLSASHINDFKALCPKIVKPIYVIPNCVNFEDINIDDEFLANKEKKIVYVGRIVESHKHVSRLLYIWDKIWYKHADWRLELIGDGDDLTYNMDIAEKLHLQNISFIGRRKNVVPYLIKASIVCLVSESEGLSMSLLEGMYFGAIPIAYASFSSINVFIINNVNGFSITPYKQEEYISKLEMLMMDVDLRIKLAKEAKKMTKSFSLESVTDKWIDLFSTL